MKLSPNWLSSFAWARHNYGAVDSPLQKGYHEALGNDLNQPLQLDMPGGSGGGGGGDDDDGGGSGVSGGGGGLNSLCT